MSLQSAKVCTRGDYQQVSDSGPAPALLPALDAHASSISIAVLPAPPSFLGPTVSSPNIDKGRRSLSPHHSSDHISRVGVLPRCQ